MSFFDGLLFFIIVMLGAMISIFINIKGFPRRNFIIVFSAYIIWIVYKDSPIEFMFLCLYLFLEWHIIAIYQWTLRKFGKNPAIYYHFVLFALLPLLISKVSGIIQLQWFSFLGISYITFRVVQIIIESYDELIQKSEFWNTICFLTFFPSLSSGPIDRSRRFEQDLMRVYTKQEYGELFYNGVIKILWGVLYKFVLSALFFDALGRIADRYAPQYLVAYAYIYGLYMFFDFAGYSLMAIGTAYLLGIKLPDNFNKPFISKDMKEFWDRWHISLSHWFRDFVFTRYMLNAVRQKKFKTRLNAASAGFVVNMLVMGLWHGLSVDYVVYGLYHGCLLAVTEVYQKKSKFYKKYKKSRWYQASSWFITLNLVMFGFLIFSGKFFDTLCVLRNII